MTTRAPLRHRVVLDIILSVPAICLCVFAYWAAINTFAKTSEMLRQTSDKFEYNVGEIVQINNFVRRYRWCRVDISRVLERDEDHREYHVQFVTLIFEADDPVFDRPNGYRVAIPLELRTGDYAVFSRVRYFCNGLDYIWPRFATSPRTKIHVTGTV